MAARGLAGLCLFVALAPSLGAQSPEDRGWRGHLAVAADITLSEDNAEQLFAPASLLKLVVAASAMHHLGPDHRIVTHLHSTARLHDGSLDSSRGTVADLWIEAAADPTWGATFFPHNPHEPLDRLAEQLVARGITTVSGDLVVSTAHFAGRDFPVSRALDEFPYAWAAPTSALAVDANVLGLRISPGSRPGDDAIVSLLGGSNPNTDANLEDDSQGTVRWRNTMTTVSAERHGKGSVDLLPQWQGNELVLRGEYPVSEPAYTLQVAHPQPTLHAANALRRALERHGITVHGEVRQTTASVADGARSLAQFASPPLSKRLRPILTESHNWHAEMLLRSLALEVDGVGRSDAGLAIERRFLEEEVGIAPSAFALDDASGISPYNLMTPGAVVQLLRYIWQQPWRDAFVDALAHPGKGTLDAWGRMPSVATKTGTAKQSTALAGYLWNSAGRVSTGRISAGEPVIFVDMINRDPTPRAEQRRRIRRHLLSLAKSGPRG